jgi:hypothetical protein
VATPTPPNAPEGDLQVAGTPQGASAVAALRYSIDKGQGAPKLKLLVEANGDLNGASAILAACRTGSGWGPPAQEPGAWETAPTADCQASAKGVRSADGLSYTFDLAPLMITDANGDSFVDVILVPGVDPTLPAGANGSSFQLTFVKPTSSSMSTTPTDSSTSSDFSASSSLAAGGVSVDPSSGLVDPSTLGTPPISTSSPAFTPALPPEQQQVTATAPAAQAASANNVARPPAKPLGKPALAFFILLAAGAAAWWAQRQPIPSLHRLGPLSSTPDTPALAVVEPQVGGLGRFARPRTGPAPTL